MGVGNRYDLDGCHPLVGRSVPDFELRDGRRLNRILRSGRGLLLDTRSDPAVHALASQWAGQIDYVAHEASETLGMTAFLVRPDGMIAWASKDTIDLGEVAVSAARWFGDRDAAIGRPAG